MRPYDCEACQDTGWVNIAPFRFNHCECAEGQRLRGFTNGADIARAVFRQHGPDALDTARRLEQAQQEIDARIEASMAWYARKLGIDPTA